MKAFENYNPFVIFIYFVLTVGISMITHNPIVLLLSLAGALISSARYVKPKEHVFFAGLFIVLSLANVLFSHNGSTVLIVINGNPCTYESLVYGIVQAVMVVSVLYWFIYLRNVMTSDKILYVFGKVSPKLAMLLKLTLRYIPLLKMQKDKITEAQKGLGLYKDESVTDSFAASVKVYSILTDWSLENGIITADSMRARGFGSGMRTWYSPFHMKKEDFYLLIAELVFSALPLYCIISGRFDFTFYPTIILNVYDSITLCSFVSLGILFLMPSVCLICEELRWKYYRLRT